MLGVRKGVHHAPQTASSRPLDSSLKISSHTASHSDDDLAGRVRDGLRSVSADVQCLVEHHHSEVKRLLQQIEHLKSRAPSTTGMAPAQSLDYSMVLPSAELPGVIHHHDVIDAWDGSQDAKDSFQELTAEFSVKDVKTEEISTAIDAIPEAPKDEKRTFRENFRKKLFAAMEEPSDSTKSRRLSTDSSGSIISQPIQTLLPDADSMREKVRDAISRPEYTVTDYYHKTGVCQAIATHPWFEPVTLMVIAFNAVWAAIDIDYNDATLLSDAHPIFQIAEHTFCAFFTAEWTVRFLSFRRKRDGLKDSWFVFDTILCFAFVLETWFMTIVAIFVDVGTGGVLGNASILRLFRLMRLNRMGRLVRIVKALPEMLIVIKGIGVAVRSVFFTLCLLTVLLYVFGIGFRTLASDTKLEKQFFSSVPASMLSLLLGGILPEYEDTVRDIGSTNLLMGLLFGGFMFITTITLMNFLIGVLVEAVSAVAVTEKETLTVKFVKAHTLDLLEKSGVDADGNKHLSKSEFEDMLLNPYTALAMQNMGVDVVGLVEFGEVLFQDDGEISFGDFTRLVLQLRGTNPTTVKDIVDLRKFMLQEFAGLEDYLVQVIKDCVPKQVVSNPNGGRAPNIRMSRKLTSSSPLNRVLST